MIAARIPRTIRSYRITAHSNGQYQITDQNGVIETLSEKEKSIFQLMLSIMSDRLLSESQSEFINSRH